MAPYTARLLSLVTGVVFVIVIFGLVIHFLPTQAPDIDETSGDMSTTAGDIDELFASATIAMQERRYPQAITHLSRLLEIDPSIPEAHVNLAFSHIAVDNWEAARRHLETARSLRPSQANAYFGLALIHEHHGEIDQAILAMQTFLHLSDEENQFRRRAKSAIWEWRSKNDALDVPPEAPDKSAQDGDSSASI